MSSIISLHATQRVIRQFTRTLRRQPRTSTVNTTLRNFIHNITNIRIKRRGRHNTANRLAIQHRLPNSIFINNNVMLRQTISRRKVLLFINGRNHFTSLFSFFATNQLATKVTSRHRTQNSTRHNYQINTLRNSFHRFTNTQIQIRRTITMSRRFFQRRRRGRQQRRHTTQHHLSRLRN